jgi:hypothetical protein
VSTYVSDRHQAAREYVGLGYRIIPCGQGSKIPLEKAWHENALETVEAVDSYFEAHGDCNIALCPEDMGWAVVDIDPDADTSNLDLPQTKTVKTPRGGYHLYYTGSVPGTVGKLGDHIDTRGRRSYVLLPPSIVNGNTYVEIDRRKPIAIPPSIKAGVEASHDIAGARTEELDSPTDINSAKSLLHAYVSRGNVSISGSGGNNCAYQVAAKLVRDYGLSQSTALTLMMGEWNDACQPPWSESKLREIIHNAGNYGQNEAAAFATKPAAETFAHVDFSQFQSSKPEAEARNRYTFLSGPEMHELSPPTWIIPDLIPENGVVILTAQKGSFKTFLAMDMALSIPLGRPTWGSEPTKTGLTFYGAHEGIRAIQKKHRDAWCHENGIDPREDTGFYVAPGPHIGNVEGCKLFTAEIDRVVQRRGIQPRLLILDTYSQTMMGLNENDPGDVGKFLNFCQQFIETYPGVSVLTPAHLGKDVTKGTRGSNSLEAGGETVLALTRVQGSLIAEARVKYQRSAAEKQTPIVFRGKVVQDSLVFRTVAAAEASAERSMIDPLDRRHVAAVLQEMGIRQENGVVTKVLAERMTQREEGESLENHAARVKDMERGLRARGRSDLAVLTNGHEKGRGNLLWFAPPPVDPDGL